MFSCIAYLIIVYTSILFTIIYNFYLSIVTRTSNNNQESTEELTEENNI